MNKYMQHLPSCNINQNWDEAEQALSDTPNQFRDEGYYLALEELQHKKKKCTCGMEDAQINYEETCNRLTEGREYLMGVDPDRLTVEDALEAFGFGRNGLLR